MSQKTFVLLCALFIGLSIGSMRVAAEPDADVLSWLPDPAPGEDALVVRRNAIMNRLAEVTNERVTIVKFDSDVDTRCPTLTSLFFSTRSILELLTPHFSLGGAVETNVYMGGTGPEEKSADLVVQNSTCRYVLTVKRYDRDGETETEVQAKYRPQADARWISPRPNEKDEKIGLAKSIVQFVDSPNHLNFTGIAFFAPTTFTVYLANAEKDLLIASESNSLTRAYNVEIKNAKAALRISINREFYSNGRWVNAFRR